uniref:Uncharacterized protein n=1 Tax=Panagrellus redivivus TaxID=6233 RepID=A0A7E4V1D5_PANRE
MGFPATLAVLATVILFVVADEIKCKNGNPSVEEDLCEFVRKGLSRYEESQKPFFKSVVLIALKNDDKSYTIKALGVAVAEKYFLTSVTSDFKKYRTDDDLFIIYKGSKVYRLRSKTMHPKITIGAFNPDAWQDLALIKIDDKSTLKFDYIPSINSGPLERSGILGVGVSRIYNEYSRFTSIPQEGFGFCINRFLEDPVIYWQWPDRHEYVACMFEIFRKGEYKDTSFLNGGPHGYTDKKNNDFTLYGLRSMSSLSPIRLRAYLITLIAPHCRWLSSVSNGAVKCSPPLPRD